MTTKLELSVTNARREFEEGGKVKNLPFWVYFVTCRTSLQKYIDTVTRSAGSDVAVLSIWRRYNDFLWLRTALVATYGGHIVPPVPLKDVAGTMDKIGDLVAGDEESDDWRSNEFISFRLRALDMFVKYLGRSSVAETDLVRNFLCMTNHQEWSAYKASIDAHISKSAPSWSEAISVGAAGAWTKLRGLVTGQAENEAKKLPVGSPLSRIQIQCRAFEAYMTQLFNLNVRILTQERHMSGGAPVVFDWSVKHDPKEPVPLWLLSLGHRVCSADGHVGMVRYVGTDESGGPLIGVEWPTEIGDCDGVAPNFQRYFQTKEKCASYVSPQFLYFPSNGVADPVLLAGKETACQIDSYLVPCGAAMLTRLSRIVDLTSFWKTYAAGIVEQIEMFEMMEFSRKRIMEALAKESKPDRQQALRTKLDELVRVTKEREDTFMAQYQATFLVEHRAAIREVLELFITTQKDMTSNGAVWETKMKPVLRLLQLGNQ
eukprot:PhF_6_TR35721/c0_g1_i1/m.51862